jgi:tetratricopeptide (TPR) repeat protein
MKKPSMKRAPHLLVLCGLVTGILSGCFGGEDNPVATPAPVQNPTATIANSTNTIDTTTNIPTTGQTPVPQPTTGSQAQATPATTLPDPQLTLAINNSREAELYKGWPLLVEVNLMHPDVMRSDVLAQSIVVGAEGKPWTGDLKIQVVNAKGESQSWPLHSAGAPTGAVTLDGETISTAHWWLGVEETAALAEGDYAVTGVLDTRNTGSGWQGSIETVPASLHISKAPAKLSPEEQSLNTEMLAAQAVVRGDIPLAISQLDALLAKQPDNISAMEFKGDLLAEQGKIKEALDIYNKAIKTFTEKYPDAEEPPTILMQKQHDMIEKLLETP